MGFFEKFRDTGREAGELRTVHVIDFDLLAAEIAPEHPSGAKDFEYDPAFIELEEKVKGTPEVEIGGKILQEAKEPNWAEIQLAAADLLTRTHDLRVAICLIRALVRTEGLNGLRDGLLLLQCFIERFWDTLHPQLLPEDNNDPTRRVNLLMALCDYDTIIAPLMGVTLCASAKMGSYSLRDIHAAVGKLAIHKKNDRPVPKMAAIEAAFKDCDAEALRAAAAAAADSLLTLSSLEQLLNEKIGSSSAPNFGELRRILMEMDDVLSRQLAERDDFTSAAPGKKAAAQSPAAVKNAPPARAVYSQEDEPMNPFISSRQDVIRLLDQICVYYDQNEPASPVPLLLKRAKRLVEKNFYEIMQDVAPESVAQLERLIGKTKEDNS